MSFEEDIEKAAASEILAIVVAEQGDNYILEQHVIPKELTNTVQSWDTMRRYLDYEYDAGYGGAGCHAIYAWTEDAVITVHEYDGSTWVGSTPRNPIDGEPGYM